MKGKTIMQTKETPWTAEDLAISRGNLKGMDQLHAHFRTIKADRADASIMKVAQEYPHTRAQLCGRIRGADLPR